MIPTEQCDAQSRERIQELESQCLSWFCWSTPFLFLLGYFAIGANLRWLLFLQHNEASATGMFSYSSLAIGVALAATPWILWLANKFSVPTPPLVSRISATFLSLGLISAMSFVLEHPKAKFTLEECVKSRVPQLDYVRNIAFNQQNLRSKPSPIDPGKIRVLRIGSSQINLGIDPQLLSQLTESDEVVSVCMPGMVPVQYLALVDELVLQRPTHVVCWLSEFDFFRESSLPTVRLRWCVTPANFRYILDTLSSYQTFDNRSELADLAFASRCTIWQQRNLIENIASRYWWRWDIESPQADNDELQVGGKLVDLEQGIQNAANNIGSTSLVESNFRAFDSFAQKLHQSGILLLVIEGECHPRAMASYSPRFRQETREHLLRASNDHRFKFIKASDRVPFSESDWRDAVHLNDTGREKLTHLVADYLTEMAPDSE